jgi:phosphoglycolate phosphatase/putative hydrolase of the HAD superfamily
VRHLRHRSTLYTNANYARDQVDVQIKRFAETRERDSRKRARSSRGSGLNGNRSRRVAEPGERAHAFGIPIAESVRWREELLEPADYLAATHSYFSRWRSSLHDIDSSPLRTTLPSRAENARGARRIGLLPQPRRLDTTGVSKPHELPFRKAAELAGAPLDACLSVGDRYDIDVALPLELGMGGILVDGVEDVYRLPELLSENSSNR